MSEIISGCGIILFITVPQQMINHCNRKGKLLNPEVLTLKKKFFTVIERIWLVSYHVTNNFRSIF